MAFEVELALERVEDRLDVLAERFDELATGAFSFAAAGAAQQFDADVGESGLELSPVVVLVRDQDLPGPGGDARALSCYRYLPPPSAPNPADWPARPPGVEETASYANQACFTQPPAEELTSNEYIWVTPDEADIGAQVDAAYGQLAAPAFTLTFNPPRRGIVNLPNWYWAAGPTGATLTGSSAGGLVAIAEPDHLEVDPGDGNGAFECPWAVAQGDPARTRTGAPSPVRAHRLPGTPRTSVGCAWSTRCASSCTLRRSSSLACRLRSPPPGSRP